MTDWSTSLSFPLCLYVGNLISHIFRKNEICWDTEWERYFCYKSIEVPDSYSGPHLTFPMTFCGVSKLVEAFKHKQVGTQAHKPLFWHTKQTGRYKYLKMSLSSLAVSFSFLSFFPVAAPCSICSAASWRDLETFKNPSKYQSSLCLPHQGDHHLRYATSGLSTTHFTLFPCTL